MGWESDEGLGVVPTRTRGRRAGREAVVRATLDREEEVERAVRAEVVLVESGDER
jgi:hypothetical protein